MAMCGNILMMESAQFGFFVLLLYFLYIEDDVVGPPVAKAQLVRNTKICFGSLTFLYPLIV